MTIESVLIFFPRRWKQERAAGKIRNKLLCVNIVNCFAKNSNVFFVLLYAKGTLLKTLLIIDRTFSCQDLTMLHSTLIEENSEQNFFDLEVITVYACFLTSCEPLTQLLRTA